MRTMRVLVATMLVYKWRALAWRRALFSHSVVHVADHFRLVLCVVFSFFYENSFASAFRSFLLSLAPLGFSFASFASATALAY